MDNCLFCKIVKGDIPSTKVYEDELVLAFRDIAPQAPTHVLVIPKEHISGVSAVNAENAAIAGHCIAVCAKVAQMEGLTDGFRVVSNCGDDAGQTVHHLHFHVLGGRKLNLEMA
jgi:histidine triad (HIT) family protein